MMQPANKCPITVTASAAATIHDAFRPFYRCVQPFGFPCFGQHHGQFRATQTSTISLAFLLLNTVCNFVGLAYMGPLTNTDGLGSQVLELGYRSTLTARMYAQLATNVLCYTRRHRMVAILLRLQRIDEQLAMVGVAIDHQRHALVCRISCTVSLLLMAVLVLIATFVSASICDYPIYLTCGVSLVYAYFLLAYCPAMLGYMLAQLAVRARLRSLNERIVQLDPRTDTEHSVRQMGRIFESLTATADATNDCFALMGLGYTANAFVLNIVSAFANYSFVRRVPFDQIWPMVAMSLLWNSYTQLWLTLVAWTGATLAEAGRQTGRVIHHRLNGDGAEGDGVLLVGQRLMGAMERQMGHFSSQVMHHRPSMHCEMFAFDWTLIFAIVSTTGTYLVILVQFDNADPNLMNNTATVQSLAC